jgi:large subunit ribosomal protein L25
MSHHEGRLVAEKRVKLGTAESRRLRKQGRIPGNLYGHKKDSVAFTVVGDEINSVAHRGLKVVDLELEGQVEKTLFREIQWDTFGARIQHFDLLRIDADERVTIEVTVELRGISPGVQAGGILDQPLRTLTVECLAHQIPDTISVRIGGLEIGQSISVGELELPEGSEVQNPTEAIVVQVSAPVEEMEDEEEADLAPAEPEVIGRKAEAEEEGE